MTAPDLTAMLRDTLAAHADCEMNAAYDDAGAAITAEDHWSCGITFPYDDNQTLDDVERAHQAAVLAATVRDWLGSERANEAVAGALLSDYASEYTADHLSSSDFADDATDVLAALVQQIGDRQ